MVFIKQQKFFGGSPKLKVNHAIRAPKVRVIAPDGTAEVMELQAGIAKAREFGLDLIEVSPNADPPVCKILDIGKYKYELEKKTKESRKNQSNVTVKEMRMSPKIQEHDYQTKMTHIKKFLADRHKVKVSVFFKGREITHLELGQKVVERIKEDLKDKALLQNEPRLMGRSITLLFDPVSGK